VAEKRTHSIEFNRQVVQEFVARETLRGLAKRHDICRTPRPKSTTTFVIVGPRASRHPRRMTADGNFRSSFYDRPPSRMTHRDRRRDRRILR
jgi:hypothetical protein